MDVAQALAELTELSSQVESAVVLGADGSLLGSTLDDAGSADMLAQTARDLLAAAGELHTGGSATRVEVELAEGAVFVLREGERTIAARTRANPTSGLVVYDLRTCLQGMDDAPAAKRRRGRTPKEESAE